MPESAVTQNVSPDTPWGGYVWVVLLVLAVVLSALAVIYNAYSYRALFHEQQVLQQRSDDLQVEWGQLLLEQSALASHSRIEKVVTEKLQMYVPSPDEIVVVRP